MRFLFLLLIACLFSACKKNATPDVSPTKDFSALTAIMQNSLSQLGGDAGLLIMDKTGKVLYKQYFGNYSDQTYIPIASGSKWPSMATVMTLVDEGKLSLNDPVSKFYPAEFSTLDRSNIVLRQLMSHTSGLAGGSQWISSDGITLQEAVKGIGQGGFIGATAVSKTALPYGPNGSQFAYGGVSMHVAGGIAEKVSGKTWDILFKERIADKCQMPNTNYTALGATTNYRIAGGAGTRMMEYGNFLLMLFNDGLFNGIHVLSKSSVAEMLKDQTAGVPIASTPYETDLLRQSFRYGLGCWIEEYTNNAPTVFSDQGAFGFTPWLDKKRGIIGVLFVQRTLGAVNTQPSPQTSPYTLIRNKVAELLD